MGKVKCTTTSRTVLPFFFSSSGGNNCGVAMKLIYFSGRGRAECARLLLAVGGIEYENVRIKMEEWPTMKDGTLLYEVIFFFSNFG